MGRKLKIHLEKELNGVGCAHHITAHCGYTTWESMHMTGGNWVMRRDLKGGLNFTRNPRIVTCKSCEKIAS